MNFTVVKSSSYQVQRKFIFCLILSRIFTQTKKKKKTSPPPHQVIINEAMMNEIKHSVRRSNYAFCRKIRIMQPDVKNIWSSRASSCTLSCCSAWFFPPLPDIHPPFKAGVGWLAGWCVRGKKGHLGLCV